MTVFFCSTIFAALLAVSSSKYAHNECRSQKLERCFCGNAYFLKKEYFLVNCTNQDFTDASMLKDIPIETGALIFTGNRIENLPDNIFGDDKNFTQLKAIDMSNNHIRNILGKTFHHVPAVEILILNHNDIKINYDETKTFHHPRVFSNFVNLKELHLTNAFADNTDENLANDLHDIFDQSNLTNLFRLHLEQNEIRHFKDPKVFCNLPKLTQLYLGNNYISHIDFDSFRCLKLQYLDLRNNTIDELTEVDLQKLDVLEDIALEARNMTVDLRGNPLKCASARNLYNWLLQTKVMVREKNQLQCYITNGNTKRAVNLNTVLEMKNEKLNKAITILLVVLSLILVILLVLYIFIHRDRLRNRMSPFLEAVTRKVHYTTIDSQIV